MDMDIKDDNNQSQNLEPPIAGFYFSGPIDPWTVQSIRLTVLRAFEQHPSKLVFFFTSPGGDVTSGIALYHFLRSMPVPVVMHAFGPVDSIAVLAYLAAEIRFVTEHSRFLIHSLSVDVTGNLETRRLSDDAQAIANLSEIYAQIFESRTKFAQLPLVVRRHLTGEQIILNPAQAISAGIATAIAPPDRTMGACKIILPIPLR